MEVKKNRMNVVREYDCIRQITEKIRMFSISEIELRGDEGRGTKKRAEKIYKW